MVGGCLDSTQAFQEICLLETGCLLGMFSVQCCFVMPWWMEPK